MIQGESRITNERSYRELMLDSSSSLKDFSVDRKKYYRKYIMNEFIEEEDNQSIRTGKIVETLLFEPDKFDHKFYLSACLNAPTGLMLAFVEALFRITRDATSQEGIVTRTFDEMSKEAYAQSGFKIPYTQVLNKFVGSDAEVFYSEMLDVKMRGLCVVSMNEITNAERIAEELRINFVTSFIINLQTDSRYEVLNQMQVENFKVMGHAFKAMMDKVIVDHLKRTIQVYDLKCVWAVETFYEEYYLYRRAYIQAYLYWQAAKSLTEPGCKYEGYTVLFPQFIVCDSTNYFNPLIYTLEDLDMKQAFAGFEYKSRWYPGVGPLVQDLRWALDNNIWNMSRENHLKNGVINIKKL